MKNNFFTSKLVCPECLHKIKPEKNGKCPECSFEYKNETGIWHLLYSEGERTNISLKNYDLLHKQKSNRLRDGSYEILAAMAKGNKTLDIACGQGFIEQLAPETVGVEFSLKALKVAQKNGAKNLVLADAHHLPFADNTFDISISAGSLEHMENPGKALKEMARVSKIQVLTVHTHPPIPFAGQIRDLTAKILNIKEQPIEKPIKKNQMRKLFKEALLKIVFEGAWNLPFNQGNIIKFLPEFENIPSCLFYISVNPKYV